MTDKKKRLSLSDFYFADKHSAGLEMPIKLPSGADSGEWLRVRGPDCLESISAGKAYAAAIRALDDSLKELEAECEAKADYTLWNAERNEGILSLNRDFALSVVTGWSFDEEFTAGAFGALLDQYRGLAEAVAEFHVASRDKYEAKK